MFQFLKIHHLGALIVRPCRFCSMILAASVVLSCGVAQADITNGLIAYKRRECAADLEYSIDVSTNLTSWDTSGTQSSQSVLSDDGTKQAVQVTESSAGTPYPTRFFRLRTTYLHP